jgi:hypothetical protein
MDLSKLPRLSQSDKQAPPPRPAETEPTPRRAEPLPASGPEAWISLAVGVILLLMYPRFMQWVCSRVFGTHFNEFMLDGKVVPYPQVREFWMDLGPTSFAVVLIFEGLVLAFARKPLLVWIAFGLTVAVTTYNLIYVVASYSKYGLAIISALAVAFGVYIAMGQWRMLQGSRA